MNKENSKEAVCQVFEKVNTGGVVLTVFELLTATYAAEEFRLKDDWTAIKTNFNQYKVLANTQNTDLIQSATLLSRYRKKVALQGNNPNNEEIPGVSCKRKDMLNLTLSEYQNCAPDVAIGFIKAAQILAEHHIYTARDLPYNTQLIPMAAILAVVGNKIDIAGNKNKLMRWFWCGVFGELYGSANETRYALDLPQVVDWILEGGQEPKTIYDANFNPSRLYTLRTRNSTAYKGIYALLLGEGLRDWLSNSKIDIQTYFSGKIDVHHIFPVAWCVKNNKPSDRYDCIINKTPLSGGTNKFVSGDAPSRYLERLSKKIEVSEAEFTQIIQTHLLDPRYLRNDDFDEFLKDRKERLLQIIEKATGKQILCEEVLPEEGVFLPEENEEYAMDDDIIT